jgi:glucosamine--fructose-6-phosphate aminotransferase (isomerizing)
VPGVAVLELGAGAEDAVPATKTMTATLGWLLALAAGRDAVERAGAAAQSALDADVDQAVAAARAARSYVVVGEGPALPAAEEGALKLRETNAALTLAAETSDVLHGSIAAARPDTLLLGTWCDAVGEGLWRRARTAWAAAGGAVCPVIAPPAPGADPRVAPFARAVGLVVVLQRVALEAAVARGLDPDHPAHTAKITDVGTA